MLYRHRAVRKAKALAKCSLKHLTAEPDLSVLQEPYRDIVKRALAKDPNVRSKTSANWSPFCPPAAMLCRHTRALTRNLNQPSPAAESKKLAEFTEACSNRPIDVASKIRTEFKHTASI